MSSPHSASRPHKKAPKPATSPIVKYYLVFYNVLSTLGWGYILLLIIVHFFDIDGLSASISGGPKTASSTFSRLLSSSSFLKAAAYVINPSFESRIPPVLVPFYRRASTMYARVGVQTALVQSFAILEVVHVLAGFVRSPLQTTAMQVASRLFLVWGIVEQFESTRTNPLYGSMVFAWSITEVIRYAFYACNLLGHEPYYLLYLRYTTFYVLYPLGASSEAFLIWATLPRSSPIPSWQSWIQGLWKLTDYIRAALFTIWWPGLYVMYTYMIFQRRKVLATGTGRRLDGLKLD